MGVASQRHQAAFEVSPSSQRGVFQIRVREVRRYCGGHKADLLQVQERGPGVTRRDLQSGG